MDDETIWLIRLLTAHFLADFVLQPDSWVNSKREKHRQSPHLWYHAVLAAFLSVLFTGFDGWWWIAPSILVTHLLFDLWKSYRKDTALTFAVDQFLHLAVIYIIWKIRFPSAVDEADLLTGITGSKSFWTVFLAIVFLTKPVGVIVGIATRQFRAKIDSFTEHTLERAGTWIGILERIIVFFLVMAGQWDAIGLLVAAKSILRLKDGDQKMSEYVLIGTLISISTAVLTGLLVSGSIK